MFEEPLTLWTYSSTTQTKHSVEGILGAVSMFPALSHLCALLSSLPSVLLWLDLDILAGIWNIDIRIRATGGCFQTFERLKELISRNLKWLPFPRVLQFSVKALPCRVTFLGNPCLVYIVACSGIMKSGGTAKLTGPNAHNKCLGQRRHFSIYSPTHTQSLYRQWAPNSGTQSSCWDCGSGEGCSPHLLAHSLSVWQVNFCLFACDLQSKWPFVILCPILLYASIGNEHFILIISSPCGWGNIPTLGSWTWLNRNAWCSLPVTLLTA